MRYLAVEWKHEYPDEPVLLYFELDDEGWEIRKVDQFRDGSTTYAGPNGHSGTTRLGEAAVPPIEEIAANPEFVPRMIARGEFETVWRAAHHS